MDNGNIEVKDNTIADKNNSVGANCVAMRYDKPHKNKQTRELGAFNTFIISLKIIREFPSRYNPLMEELILFQLR